MRIKRIEHIAIAVDDLDGMAEMLRDKFGIEVEYSEEIARNRTRLAMLPGSVAKSICIGGRRSLR